MKTLEAVATNQAPKAIGPYSQAVCAGGFLFCSGQIPLHPETGQIVGESIEAQTEQVLKNLEAVLRSQGVGFGQVAKTTVYLSSMQNFAKSNAVYEKHVVAPFPARATVEVARLPKACLVEIDAIALLG